MTNRYYFNRKYVKRNKKIRDLRKARGNTSSNTDNNGLNDAPILNKKHQRRVDRLKKIYSSLNVDANKIINKAPIKRRNKGGGKYTCKDETNNYKNEMNVDS